MTSARCDIRLPSFGQMSHKKLAKRRSGYFHALTSHSWKFCLVGIWFVKIFHSNGSLCTCGWSICRLVLSKVHKRPVCING